MNWWQIALIIVLNLLWLVPLVYELLIVALIDNYKINKINKEWKKTHNVSLKKKCIDCKYCITYTHHPFNKDSGRYWSFTSKLPSYCKYLKKPINNSQSRCQIRLASEAMWDEQ